MNRENFSPGGRGDVSSPVRNDLEAIAADWIARRNGGGLRDDEKARLEDWLAADPSHVEAFNAMESTWTLLREPRRTGQTGRVRSELQRGVRRRRRQTISAIGLAAALVVTALSFHYQGTESPSGVVTVAVRPDIRTLPDGSTVELNAGADIAVVFTEKERGVRLLRGEALFDVTTDRSKPFVVTAGAVAVRAVGTAFAVRHHEKHINVLVTEGTVAVDRVESSPTLGSPAAVATEREGGAHATDGAAMPASRGGSARRSEPVYIDFGKQVDIPVDAVELPALPVKAVSADELAAALAWRDRRIEFNDAQLPDVVALFNRQNRLQLQIGGPALIKRSITGVFWCDDPEGFVRLLESGFGAKARRIGNTIHLSSE